VPILGGLHHQYVRIYFLTETMMASAFWHGGMLPACVSSRDTETISPLAFPLSQWL